ISPCAAYWLTSSRICDASARVARRIVGSGAFLRGFEARKAAPEFAGKLCMGNLYINIRAYARAGISKLQASTATERVLTARTRSVALRADSPWRENLSSERRK